VYVLTANLIEVKMMRHYIEKDFNL